ncbi:DUF2846 domain-containing protein [Pseudomonas sp. RIT-PI-AD]|uniref:DUF2846 domain-containing protein n=1 Tax=Pseudomonas sp. RIT-PI-AD TaxID=3035294 RepID=UPI0021D94F17|nr:DUF2846 domain-containing protein [Pseudomonas sp. RIT-PI-AD]
MNKNVLYIGIAIMVGAIVSHSAGSFARSFPLLSTLVMVAFAAGVVYLIVLMMKRNAGVTKADPGVREAALNFTPSATHARLYVCREGFIAKLQGIDIQVDGERVAQLKSPQFTCLELSPGPHRLQAAMTAGLGGKQTLSNETPLDVRAGDILCYSLRIEMGALKGALVLEPVAAPASLLPRLKGTTMVLPLVAQVGP